MNDPRGSTWRKWDLHVHTPESLIHQYDGADPWPQFLDELEQLPPEFKVIGINDYIFLDGYKRILAERAKRRLQNIDLFFACNRAPARQIWRKLEPPKSR